MLKAAETSINLRLLALTFWLMGGWVVFDGGPETFLNWDSLQLDLTVKDLWVDEWWWPL